VKNGVRDRRVICFEGLQYEEEAYGTVLYPGKAIDDCSNTFFVGRDKSCETGHFLEASILVQTIKL
jgi:hypothetical protein